MTVSAVVHVGVDHNREPAASVLVLGTFGVFRHGDQVALGEWRSRKARDLLKILVIRGRRPATRHHLMETLWPGDDPTKLSNRLSVALATVRSVLDPAKRYASDHFVAADNQIVGITPHLWVDIEAFFVAASAGLDLVRAGRDDEATSALAVAQALYRGDVLEDDAYEDWPVLTRERARITYVHVARALARIAAHAGDVEAAIEHQLRILHHDAYDEQAHLEIVRLLSASGRHGEARRQHAVYAASMAELDVEPMSLSCVASDGGAVLCR